MLTTTTHRGRSTTHREMAVRLPVLCFLLLLSSFSPASSQGDDAYPPTTSMGPPSPSAFAYPPSLSQPPAYPPVSVSPSQPADAPAMVSPSAFAYPPADLSQPPVYFSTPSQPQAYPPGVSPSQSADASPGPIALSPTISILSPSPTVADQSPPTYPPSPSLPTYPPSASPPSPNTISWPPSPSQPNNPPSQDSPIPAAYPPSRSPGPSPSQDSPIPAAYPPSRIPGPSPSQDSPIPAAYPPSRIPGPSPSQDSPIPVAYPPGRSPGPSPNPSFHVPIPSPTYPPSPSPSSPTYPPSPSPAPAIYPPSANAPTYPPILSPGPSSPPLGLTVGHYSYSCPNAESIVREAVKSATDADRGTGAGLIRLFFHDCFVRGCDASVLLNTTGSDDPTELLGAPNLTLRGFEVINAAKAALEEACPGIVSCADIVAFAGRDASFFLSSWATGFDMPAGRYDGRVSLASETIPNLPAPFFGLQKLIDSFAAKGLNLEEMVTLSGAHSIGRSQCSSFSGRLSPSGGSDMDPALAASLRKQCSSGGDFPTAVQDLKTPDDLDTQYYENVVSHEVLYESDAALMASNQTASMVLANAHAAGLWESRFKAAMVKMGGVGVKTIADGEIRKKCWIIN